MPTRDQAFDAMTLAQRRDDMHYTDAKRRTDNCRGCKFATLDIRDPDTIYARDVLTCSVGGFAVAHAAICEHWEKAK